MYRITTENGRVGHIAGTVFDGADGRVVTTVCGKTYPEEAFHIDETLEPCGACDKKFYNIVDAASDVFPTEKEAVKHDKQVAKEAEKAVPSEPVTKDK